MSPLLEVTFSTTMVTHLSGLPTPMPTTDPILEYEAMNIDRWTKIVVTIPFALCSIFGVILTVLHKMKVNHDGQIVHPVKPVEI